MKKLLLLAVVIAIPLAVLFALLFNAGSDIVEDTVTRVQDQETLTNVFEEIQENPDGAVAKCENVTNTDARHACFGMYLVVKAERNEPINSSICEKVAPDVKEQCQLYAALPRD